MEQSGPASAGGYIDGQDLAERVSLSRRVVSAWGDMATSTRRLIDEDPSEARLLFYVVMSDIVFFLSWTLKAVVAPTGAAADRLPIEIGVWLVLALMARTSAMYLFAIFLRLLCLPFGGRGGWSETRAGLFWAVFVSAPFGLLAALVAVGMTFLEPALPVLAAPELALPPYYLGLVPFLWFIAAGVAEAQGFRRPSFLFMFLAVASVALSLAGLILSTRGV